jgi:hypothetical protein
MLVVLWPRRAAIREALVLAEQDLDWRPGSVLVRQGKGGRRRGVGMDELVSPSRILRARPPGGPERRSTLAPFGSS